MQLLPEFNNYCVQMPYPGDEGSPSPSLSPSCYDGTQELEGQRSLRGSPGPAGPDADLIAFWNLNTYQLLRCTQAFSQLVGFPIEKLKEGFHASLLDPVQQIVGFKCGAFAFTAVKDCMLIAANGRIIRADVNVYTTEEAAIWHIRLLDSMESHKVCSTLLESPTHDQKAERRNKPWQSSVTKFSWKKVKAVKKRKNDEN